jgi:hypothetical protein
MNVGLSFPRDILPDVIVSLILQTLLAGNFDER